MSTTLQAFNGPSGDRFVVLALENPSSVSSETVIDFFSGGLVAQADIALMAELPEDSSLYGEAA